MASGSPGEITTGVPTRSALLALEKQAWEEKYLKSHFWVSQTVLYSVRGGLQQGIGFSALKY